MNNIFHKSANFINYDLFVREEFKLLKKLEKRILVVAIVIFAIFAVVYLTKSYLTSKINGDEQESEEGNDIKKPANRKIATPETGTPIIQNHPPSQKSSKEILSNIYQQIDSTPVIFPFLGRPKAVLQKLYHREIGKFENFLIAQQSAPIEIDVAYICIGHGSVSEQVWPGFIFEALQEEKRVETLLIEDGCKYSQDSDLTDLFTEYSAYLQVDPNKEAIEKLDTFSVKQFLCGFPNDQLDNDSFEDSMSSTTTAIYPVMGNIYWKNRKQATSVLENFNKYIEKILSQGKKVVLGDHRGWLDPKNQLVSIYNAWIKKYPDQIYFLWGWEQVNLMTNRPLTAGDLDPKKHSFPWTYHNKLATTTL